MKRLRILWLLPILAIACLAAYYFQPYDKLPPNTPIDRIVVLKSKHQMLVYSNGVLLHSYHVALGKNPNGPRKENMSYTPKIPTALFTRTWGFPSQTRRTLQRPKNGGSPPGVTLRSTACGTTSGILDGFSVGGIGQTDASR